MTIFIPSIVWFEKQQNNFHKKKKNILHAYTNKYWIRNTNDDNKHWFYLLNSGPAIGN